MQAILISLLIICLGSFATGVSLIAAFRDTKKIYVAIRVTTLVSVSAMATMVILTFACL